MERAEALALLVSTARNWSIHRSRTPSVRLPTKLMIPLTPLESDILGDMAWGSHNVGEIIAFIRSAHPLKSDAEIHRDLLNLLSSWIDRGWIRVVEKPAYGLSMTSISELIPFLEGHDASLVSVESSIVLPEIDLTDQAFVDVEWLRGAV